MRLKITSDNLFPVKYNTHRLMCNYVWLEQLNVCAKYGIFSDKMFVLLDKICKLYKVV